MHQTMWQFFGYIFFDKTVAVITNKNSNLIWLALAINNKVLKVIKIGRADEKTNKFLKCTHCINPVKKKHHLNCDTWPLMVSFREADHSCVSIQGLQSSEDAILLGRLESEGWNETVWFTHAFHESRPYCFCNKAEVGLNDKVWMPPFVITHVLLAVPLSTMG